jgi:hypothetical protein
MTNGTDEACSQRPRIFLSLKQNGQRQNISSNHNTLRDHLHLFNHFCPNLHCCNKKVSEERSFNPSETFLFGLD